MKTFYGTFGFNQTLHHSYVKIEAEDYAKARDIMVGHYGRVWAFLYPESEFDSAIQRFDLKEVPLGTRNVKKYEDG